jgi:hypothetical protein
MSIPIEANCTGGSRRRTREELDNIADDGLHPAKRRCQSQFNVEDIIMRLREPEKAAEKERLAALKGEVAVDALDSLQAVRVRIMP